MGLRSAGMTSHVGSCACFSCAVVCACLFVSQRIVLQPRKRTDVPITNLNKTSQEQSLVDDGGGPKQRSCLGRVKQSFAHASAK